MMSMVPESAHPYPAGDSASVPRGFTRRLISSVGLLFVATMALFLTASFLAEKRVHYRETFDHLEETLGVLALLPQIGDKVSSEALSAVEQRLKERTGVPHRLLLRAKDGSILAASDSDLIGRAVESEFQVTPYSDSNDGRAFASHGGADWLVAARSLEGPGAGQVKLLLMRLRGGSERFVSKFLTLHGLHLVVTLLLFVVLLRFIGARYVREPIERLAAHVRKVEQGDFGAVSEVRRQDEFGWLASRFEQMGTTLKKTVEKLVRSEKYASVSVVAFRIARDMSVPLHDLKRHILYMENLASQEPELQNVATALRKDRDKLIDVILRLEELRPPEGEPSSEAENPAESPPNAGDV